MIRLSRLAAGLAVLVTAAAGVLVSAPAAGADALPGDAVDTSSLTREDSTTLSWSGTYSCPAPRPGMSMVLHIWGTDPDNAVHTEQDVQCPATTAPVSGKLVAPKAWGDRVTFRASLGDKGEDQGRHARQTLTLLGDAVAMDSLTGVTGGADSITVDGETRCVVPGNPVLLMVGALQDVEPVNGQIPSGGNQAVLTCPSEQGTSVPWKVTIPKSALSFDPGKPVTLFLFRATLNQVLTETSAEVPLSTT